MAVRAWIPFGEKLAPAVPVLLLVACTGVFDDPPAGPPGSMRPPAGCTAEQTASQHDVGVYLETTCARAACHLPIGTQAPSFASADLPALVESGYAQRLLARMAPRDPHDIMPPTRSANPPADIALVQRWLDAGTPTACDTPTPRPAPEPNALDQGALFSCADPSTAAPGPRRVRRVGSSEWVHAVGGRLTQRGLVANPWRATSGPYSTFTANESVDASSFLLYLDTLGVTHTLPGYSYSPWYHRDLRARGYDLGCMRPTSDAAAVPDAACRDTFVDAAFHAGSFARAPSDEERAELRGFLDGLLSDASAELVMRRDALRASSGDATAELPAADLTARRNQVMDETFDASFVLFGALHRPEGDAPGRLSTDEIGLALASALTTYLPNQIESDPNPRPEIAWVAGFRAAQAAGTLDTDAGVRDYVARLFDLESGYAGGVTPATPQYRPDLQGDYTPNGMEPVIARRGEYWLAPRIADFFREYFDYGGVAAVAKDDAGETSRWDFRPDAEGEDSFVHNAYTQIVAGGNGEPGMSDQLDDAIARAVVEAEQSGGDVFQALLTGRVFRVPAVPYGNARTITAGTSCNPVTCVSRECCTGDEVCVVDHFDASGTPLGYCSGTFMSEWFQWARMYDVGAPIVEDAAPFTPTPSTEQRMTLLLADPAHAARWVTMPEGQRAGVLTHPTWLAAHGGNAENDPSIVHRGRWIREHLFCESVAGLDLVQLDASLPPSETLSGRARLEAAMGPTGHVLCANAACHGRMNTLGEPFEIYNHAGYLRVTDHGGAPNGHATITNWPGRGTVEVDDAVALTTELAADPYARRCFLRHVFRYFMGRYETAADACTLTAMEQAFAGGSLMSALTALYTSPTFLYRADGATSSSTGMP